MKVDRQTALNEIARKLAYHPGDAPWSCVECYHCRPCVEQEILLAAKRALEGEAAS